MVELPQYKLKLSIFRLILPEIFKLLILGIILIAGIWLNSKFISLPSSIIPISIIILIVLIVLEILLHYVKYVKFQYLFYLDRIEEHKKTIKTFYYNSYTTSYIKKNGFDKLLNTGTIILSKEFKIGPVLKVDEISKYLINLINYSRRK